MHGGGGSGGGGGAAGIPTGPNPVHVPGDMHGGDIHGNGGHMTSSGVSDRLPPLPLRQRLRPSALLAAARGALGREPRG